LHFNNYTFVSPQFHCQFTLLQQTNKTKHNTTRGDSMSMHALSEKLVDYHPTADDVLCGRGKALARHPGNVKFSKAVRASLQRYSQSTKRTDKTMVVASVVSTLRKQGVRFIKKDSRSTAYVELSEDQAKEKAGHAIRDLLKTSAARLQRKGARKYQSPSDMCTINVMERASPSLTSESTSLSGDGLDFEDELAASIHSLLPQSHILSSALELSEVLYQDDSCINNARRPPPKRVSCNDEFDLSLVEQQGHGVIEEVLSFDPATCGDMMSEQQQHQHLFKMREQQQRLFKMEEQFPAEVKEVLSLDAGISRDWREEPPDDSVLPLPITYDLTIECIDMWLRVHEILSENSPPQSREFTLFPPPSRLRSI
jgi:hypothetical protein